MTSSYFLLGLVGCLYISSVWSLQVTPNSPCSILCIDDPTTDVSDPNSSNTYRSDIACNDADYVGTSVGRKFKQCLTCLQNSTASSGSESDQGWFFYNLRYAFDTCLFDAANASDPISTPCSTDTVCAPLKNSLEQGLQDSSTMGELYSYCTANNNTFVGSYLGACESCLRENNDLFYLSNFLVALDAGCIQEPANDTAVGLNTTLFSNTQVSIIAPITPHAATVKPHKHLSVGAIVGIVVGAVVLLVIVAATSFICVKKRSNAMRLKMLRSPLDERFGAVNITAPNKGAYSSPLTSPGLLKDDIKMIHGPPVRNFSISRPSAMPQRNGEWGGAALGTPSTTISSLGSPPGYEHSPPNSGRHSVPTHHAYIPPEYTPPSNNNTSAAYVPPPPPIPNQGIPATYPQRSPSTSIQSAGSTPNTSPRYIHHSPHSSSNSNARSPGSPPLPSTSTSRSGSQLGNRNPNTSISPSLINSMPSSPPTIYNFSPSYSPQAFNFNSNSNSNTRQEEVSHPMPRVSGRFRNEEEARKARETLYREGLAGRTIVHGREDEPNDVGRSPDSEVSEEELWPGNY